MCHKKCRVGFATMRSPIVAVSLLISAALAGTAAGPALSAEQRGDLVSAFQSDDDARARARESYGNLALQFEANHGQTDPRVKFVSRGAGYTLFLTSTEASLVFAKSRPREVSDPFQGTSRPEQLTNVTRTVLRAAFVGADPGSPVVRQEELPGKVNYFIGRDPTRSHRVQNVPTYAKVQYQNLYPDIDLVYYGGPIGGTGAGAGIHWHMNRANQVDYVADEKREQIPYVRVSTPDGRVREYFAEGVTPAAVEGKPRRRMDCLDCHTRPAHTFGDSAERAVDAAIGTGQINATIPFIRREAVSALRGVYATQDIA